MTRNFIRLIVLTFCCTAVLPLAAIGNTVSSVDSSSLAARTDAFVEKARLIYPSDPNCNLSVVKEFATTNGTTLHLSNSVGRYIRWMDVPGILNLRDIGGWNGMAAGKVYRGSCNAAKGVDGYSNVLGFKTEIDLREKSEIKEGEVRSAPNYANIPLKSYTNMFNCASAASYANVLRMFKDESNYPIYIHCAGGADRTASIVFLLDGLCGVSRTDAEIDYELTSLCGAFGVRSRDDDSYKPFRPTMLEMMNRLGENWNEKVEGFIKTELGLIDEEIESIRKNLMDKGRVAKVVRDIAYDSSIGRFGLGDLYLPEKVTPETPVVLTIHGGGWGAGDRYSWSGVAEFFCRDLGFASFNIEYRLASASNRWSACGDDCVKAANWLFSDGFRERAGFTPRKIYICGGSAGGHLTLWTLVNMPPEKIAGAVSISSIGDPEAAYHALKRSYRSLFGEKVGETAFAAMNPILRIKPGMAPVLCTHVTEDKVVPIASHKAFADAYSAVGNVCEFFEYPTAVRKGLTGHCIWIPGSKPHRLIPEIETKIAAFVQSVEVVPSKAECLRRNLLEIGRSRKFIWGNTIGERDWNDGTKPGPVLCKTGVSPIVYSADFQCLFGTFFAPGRCATNRVNLAAYIKRAYDERRAVPIISWHFANPYTPAGWKAFYGSVQPFRYRYGVKGYRQKAPYPEEHRWVLREIVDGTGAECGAGRDDGSENERKFPSPRAWYEWNLKEAAAFCRALKDKDGKRIPIVFRLFHECECDWFWWGSGSATPQDYIAAWRLTVDILRQELGRENVLFCYCTDRKWGKIGEEGRSGFLARYPGDDYVDMIGYDDYELGEDRDAKGGRHVDAAKSSASVMKRMRLISEEGERRGKVCGLFECGIMSAGGHYAKVDAFYSELRKVMTAPGVNFAFAQTYVGKWTCPQTEAGWADMRTVLNDAIVITGKCGVDICGQDERIVE